MSTQQTELNRILEIIGKIAKITADGDYIYRGEQECYEKVSSNLWRELEEAKALHLDIESVQKAELEKAKRHSKETDELEILTEIQHFGGKTNLIDFTTDYYIALFFVCNGSPAKDGRIILQDKDGIIKDWLQKPRNADIESRVGIQKSIFVRPPDGFVEPDIVIVIPKDRQWYPQPKGWGLCFLATAVFSKSPPSDCRSTLGNQACPFDIDSSVDVSVVV